MKKFIIGFLIFAILTILTGLGLYGFVVYTAWVIWDSYLALSFLLVIGFWVLIEIIIRFGNSPAHLVELNNIQQRTSLDCSSFQEVMVYCRATSPAHAFEMAKLLCGPGARSRGIIFNTNNYKVREVSWITYALHPTWRIFDRT